uniref:MINDY deubiquitinase domain-containing protein n=1 Tax=Schistocephalus solidus TaxID=70667 RepID=A0A0V0J1S2_SCHSO
MDSNPNEVPDLPPLPVNHLHPLEVRVEPPLSVAYNSPGLESRADLAASAEPPNLSDAASESAPRLQFGQPDCPSCPVAYFPKPSYEPEMLERPESSFTKSTSSESSPNPDETEAHFLQVGQDLPTNANPTAVQPPVASISASPSLPQNCDSLDKTHVIGLTDLDDNSLTATQNLVNETLSKPTTPIPASTIFPPADQTQRPSASTPAEEVSPVLPAPSPTKTIHRRASSSENPNSTRIPSDVAAESDEYDAYHQVRWITFSGRKCAVITQNKNGPCPMLALANVLLLRGTLSLPEDSEIISGERIIACLSHCLFSLTPEGLDDEDLPNYEKTVSDALNVFPSLQTGLDINVRFTGVTRFEYTSALSIFDLFKIGIYHGWVVDPSDHVLAEVIQDRTYNQLVEAVIGWRSSENPDVVQRGFLAEAFLENTASQLTVHGLCQLADTLRKGQLAVFFRNNHFSTIYRHNDSLYTLLTDAGFANEPNFVWETLNDVDGNTQFVDANFKPSTTTTALGTGTLAQVTPSASGVSSLAASAPPPDSSPSVSPSPSSLFPDGVIAHDPKTWLPPPTAPPAGVTTSTTAAENAPAAAEVAGSLKSPLRLPCAAQPADFQTVSPVEASQRQVGGLVAPATTEEDSNYQLALRLQREMLVEASKGLSLPIDEHADYELARRLQEAELSAAKASKPQQYSGSTALSSDYELAKKLQKQLDGGVLPSDAHADYELARRLQESEVKIAETSRENLQSVPLSDYELAEKLQKELNMEAARGAQTAQQQRPQVSQHFNSGNRPTNSTRSSPLHSGGTNHAHVGHTPSPGRRASNVSSFSIV